MSKKILITGGAGFIGSHLAEGLLNMGHEVIIVDNLSRGNCGNINSILNRINFVKGNVTDPGLMQDLIKSCDTVFHLAALSRVIPSIDNPELCFKSNIEGTEIIARLCSQYGKRLVFSSSREVYGTAKYSPVDEKHPLDPENPYGTSKVAGEKIIESYSKCYNLKYAILRLANVYGQKDFDRVIPIFIKNSLNNKDIIIYGGQQILDFVYISDVIEAFLKAYSNNENLLVNIGSGKGTTLLELANIIKKITKNEGKIKIKDKRKGEVEIYISNINKSHEILEWKPEISLTEGIKRLL
ncbi:MAG: GDP-mannose 4,6-dehydratase [Candidatus Methanoperedens sp.]|nr:GDP-mannose 4,6-dehydratase [Candidatus Methanoperedens sp.]